MHEHTFLGTATVGERGQIAIPAEARRNYSLDAGDKVLFFSIPNRFGLCMIKAEEMGVLLEHLSNKAESLEKLLAEVKTEKQTI